MGVKILAAITAALIVTSGASAQPVAQHDDPVVGYYHSYRASIEAGDLAAAETAAVAAFQASEEQDHGNGRTAVLAENLALVRLERGEAQQALEPANRALALAQTGGGVEPLMARLVQARAEIMANPSVGGDHLIAALNEANTAGEWDEGAYPAAVALGNWALSADKYDIATIAWTAADLHAGASLIDPVLAHAVAKTGMGATLLLQNLNHQNNASLERAHQLLSEAMHSLYPYAVQERSDHQFTPAQSAYAQAQAWSSFIHTDFRDGRAETDEARRASLFTDANGRTVCPLHWAQPSHSFASLYPDAAMRRNQNGVVVLRVLLDDNARVVKADAAAAAPPRVFTTAAQDLAQVMPVTRADFAPADCTMPHVAFLSINYRASPRG
jgi:hypothetical protein